MKKTAIAVLLCLIFTLQATASISTKRLEWYFTPAADQRPSPPAEAHFMTEHNAHYIGKDEKCVYLTFDLGYENENVGSILDTLKSEGVPATFFMLRHTVVNGRYLDRIIAEGHTVANHSTHHKDMTEFRELDSFREELEVLEKAYTQRTGKELAKIYRPPCGAYSEQTLAWANELGYKTLFWSLAYADWDNNDQMKPDAALELLLSRMHNGAVILLHPTSSTNAKILPLLIKELKSRGYSFKSAEEI